MSNGVKEIIESESSMINMKSQMQENERYNYEGFFVFARVSVIAIAWLFISRCYAENNLQTDIEFVQQFTEFASYENAHNFLTDDLLQGLDPVHNGGINKGGCYITNTSLGDANSCGDPGQATPVMSSVPWYQMPAYAIFELAASSDITEIRLSGVVAEGTDVPGDSKTPATSQGDIFLGCSYQTNPGGMPPIRHTENAIEVLFESEDIWTPVVPGLVYSGTRTNEKGFWQGSWKFDQPLENVQKIKFALSPASQWGNYGSITRLVEADVLGKKSTRSIKKELRFIPFNQEQFSRYGFVTHYENVGLNLCYSASGFAVAFQSEKCRLRFHAPSGSQYWIQIDDEPYVTYQVFPVIDLSAKIMKNENDIHTLRVIKKTEPDTGIEIFSGIEINLDGKVLPVEPPSLPKKKILFLGDSITVGLQSPQAGETDVMSSYAGILGKKLDADIRVIAKSGIGVHKGWRNVTFLPELKNILTQEKTMGDWQPNLIVVNLGTNDFSRGVPGEDYQMAMKELVCYVHEYYKDSTIIVMVPWTYGCYAEELRVLVSEISKEIESPIHYLQTDPKTWICQECMSDNTHPNWKGHQYVADKLHEEISHIMNWN